MMRLFGVLPLRWARPASCWMGILMLFEVLLFCWAGLRLTCRCRNRCWSLYVGLRGLDLDLGVWMLCSWVSDSYFGVWIS